MPEAVLIRFCGCGKKRYSLVMERDFLVGSFSRRGYPQIHHLFLHRSWPAAGIQFKMVFLMVFMVERSW